MIIESFEQNTSNKFKNRDVFERYINARDIDYGFGGFTFLGTFKN